MQLSLRFISAYNEVDTALHEMCELRQQVPYTEAVRQASQKNDTVKNHEDDLFAYGRLRNAIVHSAKGDVVIAEPHEDVVENFEYILSQILKPVPARKVLGEREIICVSSRSPLIDAVRLIYKYKFSNIPVVTHGRVNGLLTPKDIVVALGAKLSEGDHVEEWLQAALVADITHHAKFAIVDEDITAAAASNAFLDPKLRALILTKTGTSEGEVVDIITSGDVGALSNAILR